MSLIIMITITHRKILFIKTTFTLNLKINYHNYFKNKISQIIKIFTIILKIIHPDVSV